MANIFCLRHVMTNQVLVSPSLKLQDSLLKQIGQQRQQLRIRADHWAPFAIVVGLHASELQQRLIDYIVPPSQIPKRAYGKQRIPYPNGNHLKSTKMPLDRSVSGEWNVPASIQVKTRLLARGINELRDEIYEDLRRKDGEEVALKIYWDRTEYRFLRGLDFPDFVLHLDLILHKGSITSFSSTDCPVKSMSMPVNADMVTDDPTNAPTSIHTEPRHPMYWPLLYLKRKQRDEADLDDLTTKVTKYHRNIDDSDATANSDTFFTGEDASTVDGENTSTNCGNLPHQRIRCHLAVSCSKLRFFDIFEFETHYQEVHSNACLVCQRVLPTPHLLSLHISECHDSYFAVAAERQNMYECYVEGCFKKFSTPRMRRLHLHDAHQFPKSFDFDIIFGKHPCGEATSEKSTSPCNPSYNTNDYTNLNHKKSHLRKKQRGGSTAHSDMEIDVADHKEDESNTLVHLDDIAQAESETGANASAESESKSYHNRNHSGDGISSHDQRQKRWSRRRQRARSSSSSGATTSPSTLGEPSPVTPNHRHNRANSNPGTRKSSDSNTARRSNHTQSSDQDTAMSELVSSMRQLRIPSEIRFGRGGHNHALTAPPSRRAHQYQHTSSSTVSTLKQTDAWSFGKVMSEHIKRRPRKLVQEQKDNALAHSQKVRARPAAVTGVTGGMDCVGGNCGSQHLQ
ncbi:hypothetical protein SeMB42_g03769 [Synchytrium endobioticum]|uniref:C2H2-type domain-containing protein n=1 Tax=Synchytrium endobioticum TaxID=286115 RepID=A0A507D4T5_9FUNG|nr:hypothetical protein SeLEV6574_g03633 [Synchytrium endobioticum]TPX46260.1 hypothetical protein SeMB42_g03769 [Synchytrium endobioticum]